MEWIDLAMRTFWPDGGKAARLYKRWWSIGHCVFNLTPGFHLRWVDCLSLDYKPKSICFSSQS